MLSTRDSLQIKRHTKTESRRIEKDIHTKNVGVAILTPDKIDFKTTAISTDKEGPRNSSSGNLFKETQNTNATRHIHPYVHCNIIYKKQDMKAT